MRSPIISPLATLALAVPLLGLAALSTHVTAEVPPNVANVAGLFRQGLLAPAVGQPINYHDGLVLANPLAVHIIWYGSLWTAAQKSIVTDFIAGLDASQHWAVTKKYYELTSTGKKIFVTSQVTLGTQIDDTAYSQGKKLGTTGFSTIVQNAVQGGKIPLDGNGIVLLLTDSSVTEKSTATDSFCTSYCGYHDWFTFRGTNYTAAFIGNPSTQCLTGCAAPGNTKASPNGDPGVDAMISVIYHEISEAASDPFFDGWYQDSSGQENADLCAWKFGTTASLSGYTYNAVVSGRNYLVQQNYDPVLLACKP